MKNLLTIFILCFTTFAFSQVIIGDKVGTATNKNAVLLEFAAGQNKGIILPYVRVLPTTPTIGTLLVDATDEANASVKYYNGSWVDLSSGNTADISSELQLQPSTTTEGTNAKTIIGSETSAASGVLVLESSSKVLLLPQVQSIADIKSPSPGMMVYINKTGAKKLAVFNGAKWTYWGPN